jgi:hypothetical protein
MTPEAQRKIAIELAILGSDPETFDEARVKFDLRLSLGVAWKTNYPGAAYSTRIREAIADLRDACDEMEQFLNRKDLQP